MLRILNLTLNSIKFEFLIFNYLKQHIKISTFGNNYLLYVFVAIILFIIKNKNS